MAIVVDTTRELRRPLDLVRLVEAVVAAGPTDEGSWIEWKSELDLSSPEGAFKAARAILGFANRMPDTAGNVCEGLSYLIIGAEPGQVKGTPAIDGADLDQKFSKYLGTDGPTWSPMYVTVQGENVLVVVVEAPRWGDRIHTLKTSLGSALLGTVYVRRQARTVPADPGDIQQLEARLMRGLQAPELEGLQVGFRVGEPAAIVVVDPTPDQVDEWIQARRTAIRAYHERVLGEQPKPKPGTIADALFAKAAAPRVNEEGIEAHLQACRDVLFDATRRGLIEAEVSLLTMTVSSSSTGTLEGVELTLTINTPHSAFESDQSALRELKRLPKLPPPRPPLSNLFPGLAISPAMYMPDPIVLPSRWIDVDGDSITLRIGQVRPEKIASSVDFPLLLNEWPTDLELTVGWTLTSTSLAGVQRGSTKVPVYPNRRVFLSPIADIPDAEA